VCGDLLPALGGLASACYAWWRMTGVRGIAVALVLAWVALASAGARRIVWLHSDASGTRPELPLFASAEVARECGNALAAANERPMRTPSAGALPRGGAERAACSGVASLRHGTTVELVPPPGACGAGFTKVRVLDGAHSGRIGCVRSDPLRVQ